MFPLLFLILCVVLLFAVMGPMMARNTARSHQRDSGPFPHERAFDILDQRLARGEIDRSEYDEKRRVISQGG